MNKPSIGSIFPTPKVLAFAGDWHANFLWARKVIRQAAEQGVDVVIHTGDFGYDYLSTFIQALQAELEAHGILLLFVRGNHDDPDFLDGLDDNDAGFKPLAANIWYVPQGTSWMWAGIKFLGLGGAHSIDRNRPHRIEGKSWWPRETISTVDAYKAVHSGRADVMVTHDCPAGVAIPGLEKPSSWDPRELALSHRHRERLYEVWRKVKPGLLVHGHYHNRYQGHLDETTVIGLDCDGSAFSLNMIIMTLDELKERYLANR